MNVRPAALVNALRWQGNDTKPGAFLEHVAEDDVMPEIHPGHRASISSDGDRLGCDVNGAMGWRFFHQHLHGRLEYRSSRVTEVRTSPCGTCGDGVVAAVVVPLAAPAHHGKRVLDEHEGAGVREVAQRGAAGVVDVVLSSVGIGRTNDDAEEDEAAVGLRGDDLGLDGGELGVVKGGGVDAEVGDERQAGSAEGDLDGAPGTEAARLAAGLSGNRISVLYGIRYSGHKRYYRYFTYDVM